MKVLLYGNNSGQLVDLLADFSLELVSSSPDVIISYGGDGTFIMSERDFPGIPKVMIRDSKICKKCTNLPIEETLERLSKNDFIENTVIKLETTFKGKRYVSINDVIISHANPAAAIRYNILINDIPYLNGKEIIGDGIVLATPFGSGAYYRSITDGVFSVGIGLAFNNSTEQTDHIIIKETDEIRFVLTRGEAILASPAYEPQKINEGDEIHIKASEDTGKILTFGEEFKYWAH